MRGSQLSQGESALADLMSQGRQIALARNESVEVRFVEYADPEAAGELVGDPTTWKFRALQLMEVGSSGVPTPIKDRSFVPLPLTVMMNPSLSYSSLLGSAQPAIVAPTAQDPPLPRNIKSNYKYVAFRFLPDGSTNLSPTQAQGGWFVTVHGIPDYQALSSGTKSIQQVNFFTLQIDSVNGATHAYRPVAI